MTGSNCSELCLAFSALHAVISRMTDEHIFLLGQHNWVAFAGPRKSSGPFFDSYIRSRAFHFRFNVSSGQ